MKTDFLHQTSYLHFSNFISFPDAPLYYHNKHHLKYHGNTSLQHPTPTPQLLIPVSIIITATTTNTSPTFTTASSHTRESVIIASLGVAHRNERKINTLGLYIYTCWTTGYRFPTPPNNTVAINLTLKTQLFLIFLCTCNFIFLSNDTWRPVLPV